MTIKKEPWFNKQKKDVDKIFSPKVDYDKKYDILYITWFPQLDCEYSLESSDDFVFDISKGDKQVKGIEIVNFKKRFMK